MSCGKLKIPCIKSELFVIENSLWAMDCSHCGKIKSNHHCMASGGVGGNIFGAIICAICSSSFGDDDGKFWCSHHSTGAKVAAGTTISSAAKSCVAHKGVRISSLWCIWIGSLTMPIGRIPITLSLRTVFWSWFLGWMHHWSMLICFGSFVVSLASHHISSPKLSSTRQLSKL